MSDTFKQTALRSMSGEDRSLRAAALRAATVMVEPIYATAMRLRNAAYRRGIFRSHYLGRPTISVGNITTGGTGKTPVVQWLAAELRRRGHRPAILLRGYASEITGLSDEADLLRTSLNDGGAASVIVQANASRVVGAKQALAIDPAISHFILDDGFQHQRARRDFNLVLISATQPFGFDHVLPRGLLREPVSGLQRADAFLITRCGQATPGEMHSVERRLAEQQPGGVILHCDHRQTFLWMPLKGETQSIDVLRGTRVFITAGIGDPVAFARQIAGHACTIAGTRWFDDHHAFTPADVESIFASARSAGATLILTTEKDWVKLRAYLETTRDIPIAVVRMEIRFQPGDAERLMETLQRKAVLAI